MEKEDMKKALSDLIELTEHYLDTSKFYGGGRIRLVNKINEIKAKLSDERE